ncbi:MAG TPA: hypothetical protein VFM35_02685 [Candidatus Binatia bacterium]|nr:hypothetical protein [Candidatus Binatia bacterium]
MAVQSGPTGAPVASSSSSEISDIYLQGIVAGLIGAATVAIWFFIVDVFSGRPFFTPNVLGTALFRRGIGLDQPQTLPISFEMVLFYTWVHGLAFCVIGGLASKLLALAERNLNLGFGILLFFVIFEFGFVGAASIFAEPILQTLAWPSVLVGNLLAAVAMAAYFLRHHPNLSVSP